jgi:hypothetical protein
MIIHQEKLLWMLCFGFVSGHDFSRAVKFERELGFSLALAEALAPVRAHPARNACPKTILSSARVFFVTTKTSMARRLLQAERNAMLLIDVLRLNVAAGKFQLRDFVVMPDHLHLLMTALAT